MKYNFRNPATVKGTVKDKIRRVVSTSTEINKIGPYLFGKHGHPSFLPWFSNRNQWKTFKESLKKSYLTNVISEESP